MNPGTQLLGNTDLLIENDRIARIAPGESIDVRDANEVHECRERVSARTCERALASHWNVPERTMG